MGAGKWEVPGKSSWHRACPGLGSGRTGLLGVPSVLCVWHRIDSAGQDLTVSRRRCRSRLASPQPLGAPVRVCAELHPSGSGQIHLWEGVRKGRKTSCLLTTPSPKGFRVTWCPAALRGYSGISDQQGAGELSSALYPSQVPSCSVLQLRQHHCPMRCCPAGSDPHPAPSSPPREALSVPITYIEVPGAEDLHGHAMRHI